MSTSAKLRIIQSLDELPEQSLAAVAEFVETLRAKAIAGPRMPKQVKEPRPYGLAAGQFVIPDDFNEPLPPDILDAFEGR